MASSINRFDRADSTAKIDSARLETAKAADSQRVKKARRHSMPGSAGQTEKVASNILEKPRPKSINLVNASTHNLNANLGLHNDSLIPSGRKTAAATHTMVSHAVRNPANVEVRATTPRNWHPAPPPPDMGTAPPPPPSGPADPAAVAALSAPQAQDTIESLKDEMKDLLARTNKLRTDVTKFQDEMTAKASFNEADGDMNSPKAQFTVDQQELKKHQDEIRLCVKQLWEINEKFQKLEEEKFQKLGDLTHSPDIKEILDDVRMVKINLNATRKILNDVTFYNDTQKIFDFFNHFNKILETMNAQIDEILHLPGLQPHFPDI